MGHSLEAFLMGVGIYGGIAATMVAIWGSVVAVINGATAAFPWRDRQESCVKDDNDADAGLPYGRGATASRGGEG